MTDRWLIDARRRMWEAASSGNGVRYVADGDLMTVHDPSIMGDQYAVQFSLESMRYLDVRPEFRL